MLALDKKDREILYQLDLNARQPNSAIAKKVRLSKEVVGYRIGRMEREGIIQGYYAFVDITRLGFLNGRVFIKLKGASPADERAMIEEFAAEPRSWWVNSISGASADMGIAYWVRDIADFHAVKEELLNRYRGKIESYRESIYSGFHAWRRSYLSAKEEAPKYDLIAGNSAPIKFDWQDVRLLSALSANARMPLVELAKKANLSVNTAKYRLKRLEKEKVLLGFRPKIGMEKVGVYWYKVEFQLEDNSRKKAMLAYFGAHRNILYAYESIGGGTELEMEMEVESHEQFREIIDGFRQKFAPAIRTYNYYMWSAEHKIVYFPPEEFFKKYEVGKPNKQRRGLHA
ncbi:MAG: winged helix-turn-helix transcriptional regulator [Candidatus Micrarchaeota archaeon]|nr:winged helix-turn-helix transcriptional regulator [Candidatus Micrarchaeota archaeon]